MVEYGPLSLYHGVESSLGVMLSGPRVRFYPCLSLETYDMGGVAILRVRVEGLGLSSRRSRCRLFWVKRLGGVDEKSGKDGR